jgi:hypothetical protein
MLGVITGLGVAGGIGVLIGIGLVAYIKPTEPGGVGILIALPTIICVTIGAIFGARTQKGKQKGKDEHSANGDNSDDEESG